MQTDSLYWLFSSSAQAISALVAFLLAGLALVQAIMENAQQRDDTLVEIHARLQAIHYRFFKLVAIGTGFAVGLSLSMLVVNAYSFPGKMWAAAIIALFNLVVLGGAIAFVLRIIDPDRYQVTAQNIIEQDRKKYKLPKPVVADKEFFSEFVKLESDVRDFLKLKRQFLSNQDSPRLSFSFRQMIDTLHRNELISSYFYEDLERINRYRNLVFHGQAHETDKEMVDRIKAALEKFKEITPKKARRKKKRAA